MASIIKFWIFGIVIRENDLLTSVKENRDDLKISVRDLKKKVAELQQEKEELVKFNVQREKALRMEIDNLKSNTSTSELNKIFLFNYLLIFAFTK